ncbi:type II toxin-antitoxin system HicB family antitoxin [Rivularia sp. UHCC 0363]|uniref:type II toxin-antitoxin system HicB family antitoxin n=1 Tax=Rivularia sp. UHCC 0363 TaxID=3110244 RepID=UPI002B220697|nr:type II toxin-antitoxin system HicB family antitoxin [Rivularia sp. UHCC 0363]MEA5599016.1 type II toxin-antitoxin system HicB family antitoxin [Rivularia sp. UHCC 0363]
MKWRVILEPDHETGWAVWCPELPGCVSAGETQQQALENIREAIQLYLEPDTNQLASGAITIMIGADIPEFEWKV